MIIAAIAASIGLVASFGASAGDYRQFPGAPLDDRTLRIQERVEEIFIDGDYARALLIYERELAPLGDKYAQYMVGFMHLTGRGVPENPAEALAWYRLAAERGEQTFSRARDTLEASLAPGELQKADVRFAELWRRHGDRRLLLDLIRSDSEILRRRGSAQDSLAMAAGYSGNEAGQAYFRRIAERLSERLEYLASTPRAAEVGVEGNALARLENEVRRELESLDMP